MPNGRGGLKKRLRKIGIEGQQALADTPDAVRIMRIMCDRLADVYGPVAFAGDEAPNRRQAPTLGAATKQEQPNEQ